MITINELKAHANEFLEEHYNMSLDIPIKLNGRLTRSLGRFIYSRQGKSIELAKRLLMYYNKEEILDVLYHELVHYALCELGMPFDDGHPVFEKELKKHSVSSTNVLHFKGIAHVYECKECNKTFTTRRRLGRRYMYRCSCGNTVREQDYKEETIIQ